MRELEIGDLLDGYRVEALVARGGMASVFRAVEVDSGAVVALKVPHLQYEADVVFWERFRREERIALDLDHPNLVRALPPRRDRSRVYFVMEHVEGTSLALLVGDGRALQVERALDVARQTCEALAYLHRRGVVHRDVKPGNVVLSEGGRVKLLDFGIAHVETARRLGITGLSASIGTPDFMAPEQLGGGGGDARADVFALGTMLYEMLTGRLPYVGADWEERLRAKRQCAPTPPSVHRPELAPALEAVVLRAIAPELDDRYASAEELLAALRDPPSALLAPVGASPPRHRLDLRLAAAIAAIVAALAVVGGVAWLGHQRGLEAPASVGPQRDVRR